MGVGCVCMHACAQAHMSKCVFVPIRVKVEPRGQCQVLFFLNHSLLPLGPGLSLNPELTDLARLADQ